MAQFILKISVTSSEGVNQTRRRSFDSMPTRGAVLAVLNECFKPLGGPAPDKRKPRAKK